MKVKKFIVHGEFYDKNLKKEDENQPIKWAKSNYDLTVKADDMKKAIDIAIQYMPAGSEIVYIENHSRTSCRPCPDSYDDD